MSELKEKGYHENFTEYWNDKKDIFSKYNIPREIASMIWSDSEHNQHLKNFYSTLRNFI